MKKKLIAGMTSAALIASMAAPAFAANFQDVKGTPSEKAAALLKTLGVVNGDVNGNYNPNATITRAEFAKIAVLLAGYKGAADAYGTNVTPFSTDVKAGHWAAGYIQVAKDTGLIKGYDEWNFGPSDTVKYEEVLTVALRILGYNDSLPGSWPSDYVIKGTQLKLNANTAFSLGKAATRGDVALIAYAALNASTVTYSKDSDSFTTVQDPNAPVGYALKLLSKNFGTYVFGGVLESKDATTGLVTVDEDATTEVSGNFSYKLSADVNIVGAESVEALFGHTVTYILDADGNIAYIADYTTSSKLVSGALASKSTVGTTTTLTIGTTGYTVAPEVVVYKNGLVATLADVVATDNVTLILNNAGQVQAVVAKQYADPILATGVVAKTTVNKARVTATAVDGTTPADIQLADNAQIFRNGKAATLADIQAGDVVYYTTFTPGGATTLVEAYSQKVTGMLNGITVGATTTYTIGGQAYTFNATQGTYSVDNTDIGKQVVAVLDKDGKILKIDEVASTVASSYAIVQKVETVTKVVNNEVQPGTFKRVTVFQNGQSSVYWVAKDTLGADLATYATADEGSLVQISLNAAGEITSKGPVLPVTSAILANGVDAVNKRVTFTGPTTYNVTSNTVLVSDSTATTGSLDATTISFDKLAPTQTVKYVVAANGTDLAYVIVTSGLGVTNALTDATGIFVSSRVEYTGTSTLVTKVTLNVGGVNTDFVVTDAISLTGIVAGDLVTLKDATAGDSKYDTAVEATTSIAAADFQRGSVTNSFGDGTNSYVFDSNTKVYVKKGTDPVVAGALSDLTQLFNADPTAWTSVTFTTATGVEVAGKPVVTSVLVTLN